MSSSKLPPLQENRDYPEWRTDHKGEKEGEENEYN